MDRIQKNIIIAMPNQKVALGLKEHFEKENLRVLEIVSTTELMNLLDRLSQEGVTIHGVFLSDTSKSLGSNGFESFSDNLRKIKEKFKYIDFVILSGQLERHPVLAEYVEMGIYKIFVRKPGIKVDVPTIVNSFYNDSSPEDVERFKDYDRSIPWREKGTAEEKISPRDEKPKETSTKNKFHFDEEELLDIELPEPREKIVLVDRLIGTIIIAVTGVDRNVGTTHATLVLANFLARNGNSVAVVEGNNSNDFEAIEYVYEGGNGYISREIKFSIRNVDYYKTGSLGMGQLVPGNYDYILFDLGSYQEDDWLEQDFYRANVRIIVGSGSEWKQKHIINFSKYFSSHDQSKWIYCLPLVEKIVASDVKKEISSKEVYAFPAHPDPYNAHKETDEVIQEMLKQYIPQKKVSPNKKFIYGSVISGLVLVILILVFILVQS